MVVIRCYQKWEQSYEPVNLFPPSSRYFKPASVASWYGMGPVKPFRNTHCEIRHPHRKLTATQNCDWLRCCAGMESGIATRTSQFVHIEIQCLQTCEVGKLVRNRAWTTRKQQCKPPSLVMGTKRGSLHTPRLDRKSLTRGRCFFCPRYRYFAPTL